MLSFWQRLQVLGNARFEIVIIFLSNFAVGVIFYVLGLHEMPNWIAVVLIAIWLLILFITILLHEENRLKLAEAAELKEAQSKETREHAINLTTRVVNLSSRSLRSITENLRTFSLNLKQKGTIAAEEFDLLKKSLLREVFRNIRLVFEGDTRGIDTTSWPHHFFKIALFEPEPSSSPLRLRRTFYDYPEGVEPHDETEVIDIKLHQRSGAVLAFLEQCIVIIEDIKVENAKPPSVKRWVNLREHQAEEYESMICAALVSGTRGQPDRKCLGVLVIDTDHKRYFREDRPFRAFLGDLINPFRTILTFVLELKGYFPGF